MNSSLTFDYWINVFQITVLKNPLRINLFFSSLEREWLGGCYNKHEDYQRLKLLLNYQDSGTLPETLKYLSFSLEFCKDPLLSSSRRLASREHRPLPQLPSSLEVLVFESFCGHPISTKDLPRNLKELSYRVNNHQFDLVSLPSGLTSLSLKSIKQSLDLRQLPIGLTSLNLDYMKEGQLNVSDLPRSLLHFSASNFSADAQLQYLPQLLSLELGYNSSFNLNNVSFPTSLISLAVDMKIDDVTVKLLPTNLESLEVSGVCLDKNVSLLPKNLSALIITENLFRISDLSKLPPLLRRFSTYNYNDSKPYQGIYMMPSRYQY